ncbi:hypothetical protein GCM10010329_78290 [Streptomyces spiroverticillatus]|uniref:Uncharacterized protein n=1 Tax=Streptomyces finlayi TaxID=67296 RepID=A0A918X582_9ACTN|nr:hypothetical protein GCM10010329_78290 [Streptomyces spiroverticillatus]GHD13212.1 hypothetical protein GCM10010334_71060 [Streptomyces finlayi]
MVAGGGLDAGALTVAGVLDALTFAVAGRQDGMGGQDRHTSGQQNGEGVLHGVLQKGVSVGCGDPRWGGARLRVPQ